jgi:hypothetical protein
MSRRIGGTERHGWLGEIVRSKCERIVFVKNRLRCCGHMFLAFTYKLCKKQGGMCYTTKCDTVMEHTSEGNPGR